MRSEIIINVGSHETRIAILEDGRLVELLVERPENERMVGNIYKGIVSSVLPGMQAAFVDIGMEKSAFLHVSDVADTVAEFGELFDVELEEEPSKPSREGAFVPIQDLLQKGQEILIQITKDPIGTKGPRATSEISLPGRFVVLIPKTDHIAVSRKITSWAEKRRLRDLVREFKPDNYGVIIRTVAQSKGEEELKNEIKSLVKQWEKLQKRAQRTGAPTLIHREMGMTSSLIRDLFNDEVDKVLVDSKREFKEIISYLRSVSPNLRSKVDLYREKAPIFDAFEIEKEIEKALDRKIWLKAGGYIVIDHTEALVAIDVNSGKYVGYSSDQEDTILKINIEAAREIARQLRLRDIGGIIVVDFIDMESSKNRKKVYDEFQGALKRDRSKTNVSQISEFGLVEMTRQRVRQGLLYTFSEPCPSCDGIGRVQSRETTLTKIERWMERCQAVSNERGLTLHVHPSILEYLKQNGGERLRILRRATKIRPEIQVDPNLTVDDFRFFSSKLNKDITNEFKA